MFDKYIRIFHKKYRLLDDEELKIWVIEQFLVNSFLLLFLMIFLLFVGVKLFDAFIMSLGIFVAILYVIILFYKRDYMDYKYGLSTYRYLVIILLCFPLGLSIGLVPITLMKANIYAAIGYSISFLFPMLFMYLHVDMYSEESRVLLIENEFVFKEHVPVLGYFPFTYLQLAIFLGMGPLGLSLTRLVESIVLGTEPLILYLVLTLILLIIEYLFLAPETMNRIFPFELKTREGLVAFSIVIIFIIALFYGVMLFLL